MTDKSKGKLRNQLKLKSGFSVRVKIKQFCQTKIKTKSCKLQVWYTQQFKREKNRRTRVNQKVSKETCLLKVVQAKKSIWRMPWHWEPMKDVTSCDKPRWAANKLWPADFRMWEHLWWRITDRYMNQIVYRGEPPELKHLSRGRKRNQTRFR